MYCEKCNANVDIVEIDWIEEGLIMVEGYKCKKCGAEVITLVTDNKVRNNIYTEQELLEQIKSVKYTLNKHLNSIEGNTPMGKKEVTVLTNKLNKLQEEYNKLKSTNNNRCNKLLLWYKTMQKGE